MTVGQGQELHVVPYLDPAIINIGLAAEKFRARKHSLTCSDNKVALNHRLPILIMMAMQEHSKNISDVDNSSPQATRRMTAENFFAKVCNEIGTPTYKLQNNLEADNYGKSRRKFEKNQFGTGKDER